MQFTKLGFITFSKGFSSHQVPCIMIVNRPVIPSFANCHRWVSFEMKIRFSILLLTFISLTAVGQVKVLTKDSDTVFWFKEYKAIRNHIGLELTEKIDSEFYFRFWDGTKVIELKA